MLDRRELSAVTKKGVGLPIAGVVFWIVATVIWRVMPAPRAGIVVLAATGLVFPLGLLLSRGLKADVLARRKPLSDLGGVLAAVQLLYLPVLILCVLRFPAWMPFVMAVLFGSHFLPYGWLYESRGYYLLGIGIPVVATAIALAGPSASYAWTAPATAALYALGAGRILREIRT